MGFAVVVQSSTTFRKRKRRARGIICRLSMLSGSRKFARMIARRSTSCIALQPDQIKLIAVHWVAPVAIFHGGFFGSVAARNCLMKPRLGTAWKEGRNVAVGQGEMPAFTSSRQPARAPRERLLSNGFFSSCFCHSSPRRALYSPVITLNYFDQRRDVFTVNLMDAKLVHLS